MRYRAPAKVNLSLEVLGRRPDGFHDLASVMQTVSIFDEIDVYAAQEFGFQSSDPALDGEDNLVVRAARLLADVTGSRLDCEIRLRKTIPHAAGLGGGSSDAAMTLHLLNEQWRLNLPLHQLVEVGARLGSDVPFFLYGGTAFVTGRGELVQPLPDPEPAWYALINPGMSVPTGEIFGALLDEDLTFGAATHAVVDAICTDGAVRLGLNGLQRALFRCFSDARTCFEAIAEVAPGRTFVSGSGPTVGVLCDTEAEARQVVAAVARPPWWSAVAHSMPRTGV